MSRDATQTSGGYGTNPSSTFESEKPFGGREVDENLPNIWDFPEALKPGEKESPANPANRGKNFLDAFKNFKFGQDQNKYQDRAQQGGFQTGGKVDSLGGFSAQVAPNVTAFSPPAPYAPFTVAGMPGEKGKGGAIGSIAGAALGLALAPVTGGGSLALAGLGSNLGGTVGGMFG